MVRQYVGHRHDIRDTHGDHDCEDTTSSTQLRRDNCPKEKRTYSLHNGTAPIKAAKHAAQTLRPQYDLDLNGKANQHVSNADHSPTSRNEANYQTLEPILKVLGQRPKVVRINALNICVAMMYDVVPHLP